MDKAILILLVLNLCLTAWPYFRRQKPINLVIDIDGIVSVKSMSSIIEKHVIPSIEDYTARGGKINTETFGSGNNDTDEPTKH